MVQIKQRPLGYAVKCSECGWRAEGKKFRTRTLAEDHARQHRILYPRHALH